MVSFKPIVKTLASLALLASAVSALPAKVNYDGVRVVRVAVGAEDQLQYLDGVITELGLTPWTAVERPNSYVDLQIPKGKITAFNHAVTEKGFEVITMHEDLGASIRAESEGSFSAFVGSADQTWFNAYHSYADHLAWLNDVVATFPANSQTFTAGSSVAGRAITGIHIYGSSGPGTKPAIVFHGTVHAREWITTMVSEYLAYSLLNNYANSTTIKSYVDKYDFYIIPVVNPDGFVYTQSTERLWRKNRQTASGSSCIGRDINRNWPWRWDVAGGSSTNPCSETYRGAAAGDSPENQGLSAHLRSLASSAAGAKMYIDWHSYSQLFMWPYGYSCSVLPADQTEFNSLGAGYVAAIRASHGLSFDYGPICSTIYQVSGGSVDYAYDVTDIKYSFTTELRDTGNYGFVLPASQIRPAAEEIWAGVQYLLANIV